MVAGHRDNDRNHRHQVETDAIPPDLRRRLYFAHLTLWWERAWRLAWPLSSLVAGFVALALFDVLPLLPGWLHAGVLTAFVIGGLIVLWRFRRLTWPKATEALQRLEKDSALAHRPLQALTDRLSAGADDPLSQALWQAEGQRLRRLVLRLSLKLPSPELARHDPWGIRFAALLLLAVALSGGWHDPAERLIRALRPNLGHFGGPPVTLQVWLTPPAYTGKAPILLDDSSNGRSMVLPVDTSLLAMVQGGSGKAQMFLGDESRPFQTLDDKSQRVETVIAKEGRLLIRQGRRLVGHWRVSLLPVSPPSIAFAAPPETDREGRLRIDIEGSDAYGIAKAWANIRRIDMPDAPPLSISLPLGGGHPATVRQASWHDLTGNPWAGLPVTIKPEAENVAGLRVAGNSVTITLPERAFTNPVARAIVAQRRTLAATPELRLEVAADVIAIASRPESFGNDFTVFLALSTAASRLHQDQSPEAIPSVIDILWQVALRVEEGDRPEAQRAVDEIARDLERALAAGASQAEIERLMAQLQAAMARYLDALVEQARRQGMPFLPEAPDQPSISPEELQGMIDQMRALSQTGSADAARQMLSDLRQMLDGLGASLQGGASGQQVRQAQTALHDLQALADQQRRLLDDTFRRAEKPPSANGHPDSGPKESGLRRRDVGKADAEHQESLRNQLDKILQSLGDLGVEAPNALGQAEQAMRESTQALRQDELQDAIDAQSEAVTRLQEGGRNAAQSLAKRLGSGMVRQGAGRDPLGRSLPGNRDADDRTVKIPKQADLQKAREVLDELRRRAGQVERPSPERDYLQRLLKQFF
jgi:uncharacterized protein (TIGR02302 family)